MNIQLQHVLPTPLASIQHDDDSIWGNTVALKASNHILLNASSGKGKSTFTTTVVGLRTDYSGTISYDGRAITSLSSDEWVNMRQTKISTVFQDLQLFNNLTVQENLLLKNGLTNFKTEQEIKALVTAMQLEHKWNDACGILSMGQQQRIAIVRALCQPFSWLIMDEPFSHLDEANSKNCMDIIAGECVAQNAGFVLTSLDADQRYPFHYELKL